MTTTCAAPNWRSVWGIDDDAGRASGHAAYDRRFLAAVRAEQHQRRGAKAAFDAVRVILAR